ncbi:MAG: hypothetical protein J6Q95_02690 [Alistipes sp.]|nr:hypothetical protein [Alistipes sp.]
MYEFSNDVYVEVAERLMEAIGGRNFFSGVVTHYDGDVCCRLRTTVIVSRRSLPSVDAPSSPEVVVKPVWWEMSTAEGGVEMDNDFSFGEMLNVAVW